MKKFIEQATEEANTFIQRMFEQHDHYFLMVWDASTQAIDRGGQIGGIPIHGYMNACLYSPANEMIAYGYPLTTQFGRLRAMVIGSALQPAVNPDGTLCEKLAGPAQPNNKPYVRIGRSPKDKNFGFV